MALRFKPMIACRDACPTNTELHRPVPQVWAYWACMAPCCFGLCRRLATTPDGTCGDARHAGRRIIGRALFQLWNWRRTTPIVCNQHVHAIVWAPAGIKLYAWYRSDLQSLLSHPVGMPLCRQNSRFEDEHATVLAGNLAQRCTLLHHDCNCFEHGRTMFSPWPTFAP